MFRRPGRTVTMATDFQHPVLHKQVSCTGLPSCFVPGHPTKLNPVRLLELSTHLYLSRNANWQPQYISVFIYKRPFKIESSWLRYKSFSLKSIFNFRWLFFFREISRVFCDFSHFYIFFHDVWFLSLLNDISLLPSHTICRRRTFWRRQSSLNRDIKTT